MFREGLEAQGMRASLAMIITQRRSTGELGSEIAQAADPLIHLLVKNDSIIKGELGSEIAQADLVGTVTGCDCIIVDDMIDTASN